MLRVAIASLMLCLLSACTTNFKVVKPDPASGLYKDAEKLAQTDVKLAQKFEPQMKNAVYIKVPENPNPQFVTFFTEAMKDCGVFAHVYTREDLQQIVIKNKLDDRVPSLSDLIGVSRLSKEIGPILVVEPNAIYKGGYHFDGYLKVTDAGSGDVVLDIEKGAFNFSGLDAPLFHPMLNGFIHWTRNEPIAGG